MTNKEIEKYHDEVQKAFISCPNCGHKVIIRKKEDKVLCSWCKNYVFKDKKSEFKYKIKQQMKTNKNGA